MSDLNNTKFDALKVKEEKLKLLQDRYKNGKSYSINLIFLLTLSI